MSVKRTLHRRDRGEVFVVWACAFSLSLEERDFGSPVVDDFDL